MGVVCLGINFDVFVHSYSRLRFRLSAFQMERTKFYRLLLTLCAVDLERSTELGLVVARDDGRGFQIVLNVGRRRGCADDGDGRVGGGG
jgi:hypothetical protein